MAAALHCHIGSSASGARYPRVVRLWCPASLVVDRTAKPSGLRKTVPEMMTDKQAPVKMSESVSKKERELCRTSSKMSTAASSNITNVQQSNNLPLHHHHEAGKKHQAKMQQIPPHTTKKMAPASAVVESGRVRASKVPPLPNKTVPRHEESMEATKRKLRDGYQEAVDAKRRRMVRVIEAPKMKEERLRKMHPILRRRIHERCGDSTATLSHSLLYTFHGRD